MESWLQCAFRIAQYLANLTRYINLSQKILHNLLHKEPKMAKLHLLHFAWTNMNFKKSKGKKPASHWINV